MLVNRVASRLFGMSRASVRSLEEENEKLRQRVDSALQAIEHSSQERRGRKYGTRDLDQLRKILSDTE